ncbi:MAG: LolA-like putative outer membrane lipoprotein chaperone [Proteiniphilum sp.]|uniref:LolA family protein n=1 Tax=Proteiniphilum sp. TaxID=1926877 RepID=UPI002B1F82D8|nr:LolA-like putative outer membrane lipoprotein chaperone [Proteiniphilum sp.]MEA5128241.1 LolA-like putative outer membrane lipoprotein chaperone [Proteiniphilum sp.]
MRTITSLLLIFFFSVYTSAQNPNDARALLDKAYATYEASNGIRLSFKSALTDKDGAAYAPQSGEAYIKGNKFKLEMEAMDVWFDGKTQWVLMKDVNEVNVSSPTTTEIASISPLALLGMYKNGFTLKAPASKTINGKSAHLIDMVPAGQHKDFKSITAAIDKESGNIIEVILIMADGMKNKIDISGYNTNHQFSDATFTFDKNDHPGVEIVDLR